MKPPSLYSLSMQQCIRHSQFISDIGNLPYEMVKPILSKLNRDQLMRIEQACPHITDESDELWEFFIAKDFKDRKLPINNFRVAYGEFCKDKEEQLVAARERLKLKQEQYNKSKRAASVIELDEIPMGSHNNAYAFKSRTMKSMARKVQASTQLRRPTKVVVSPISKNVVKPPPRSYQQFNTEPSSPSISAPKPAPSISSPSSLSSPSITSPSIAAQAALRAKRRRTPSIFLQRK